MAAHITHFNCSKDQHYSFVTGITAGLFTQGDVQAGWDLFPLGHGDRDVKITRQPSCRDEGQHPFLKFPFDAGDYVASFQALFTHGGVILPLNCHMRNTK